MPNIVKNTTIISLLDLLAPHSCRGCGLIGNPLCDRCKNYILKSQQNICPNCKAHKLTASCPNCPDLPPTFIGGERSGLLGNIVHTYKYDSVRALAKPLAEIMQHALPASIPAKTSCIVPLPTITKHIRTRGFDHTLLLAKQLSKLTGIPVSQIIQRAKNTIQVGANHKTRQIQAAKAYNLTATQLDLNTTYILFDDVWTTGASMLACTKMLQQAGAKQIIIAILSLSRIN